MTPGIRAANGALRMTSRAVESMAPHSGLGGWTPSPRNDSDEAVNIAVPRSIVVLTIICDIAFGMMCVAMMRACDAPNTRQAWQYSLLRIVMTTPRTRRALIGTE